MGEKKDLPLTWERNPKLPRRRKRRILMISKIVASMWDGLGEEQKQIVEEFSCELECVIWR
uniref:Uncharacterized protein n=1 Tax=Laticauda laticaudata TaxID=8630 RepID=A0A8C5SCR1_LATLA